MKIHQTNSMTSFPSDSFSCISSLSKYLKNYCSTILTIFQSYLTYLRRTHLSHTYESSVLQPSILCIRNLLNIFLCAVSLFATKGSILNRARKSLKQGEFCGRQTKKCLKTSFFPSQTSRVIWMCEKYFEMKLMARQKHVKEIVLFG